MRNPRHFAGVIVAALAITCTNTPEPAPPVALPPMFGPPRATPAVRTTVVHTTAAAPDVRATSTTVRATANGTLIPSAPISRSVFRPFRLRLPLEKGLRFELNLFDDATFAARIVDTVSRNKMQTTAIAELAAKRAGRAVFTIRDNRISAYVNVDGRVFAITPVGDDYRIEEVVVSRALAINEDGDSDPDPPAIPDSTTHDDVLTVLLVFPAGLVGACRDAHFVGNYESSLYAALQGANLQQDVVVVPFCSDRVASGGNLKDDLAWLVSSVDVQKERIKQHADLVSMVVKDADVCGRAYFTHPVQATSAFRGFSVVHAACAIDNQSFVHEIGHNLGLHHDRVSEDGGDPNACNYGYYIVDASSNTFVNRTIMALPIDDCPGNCTRMPYFSDPNASRGIPCTVTTTGIKGSANNTGELPTAVATTRAFF